ncbi:MAG: phosphoribosylformylglycinamidine cyclo-ligase [Candidatus Kapaibacteriales bacterium]
MSTYKDAGVDIKAGEETVEKIKPAVKSTFNENVLSDLGHFGGFFDARFPGMEHPILVASTDGVGTKLKVAFAMKKHDTIGQCLVNHCVNDILCSGAKPLFFLDYFATGKLVPEDAANIIIGFATACRENGAALIGGETAEMPSIYADGEYDLSGTIVGVVEKSKIVNGQNISEGDILIGLKSSGLHTNGYSLARSVLFSKYDVDSKIDGIEGSLGEAMLAVHRSYLHEVYPLAEDGLLTGISHITGGGMEGNTMRIMPKNLALDIDWQSWERPELFKLIQKTGNIAEEEMRHVFNLGIGMVLIAKEENVDKILRMTHSSGSQIIGRIKKA